MIVLDLCRTDFEYRGPAHYDNRDYIQESSDILCSYIEHPSRIIGFGDGALSIVDKICGINADKIVFNPCGDYRDHKPSSKDILWIGCDPMIGAGPPDSAGDYCYWLFEYYAEKEMLIPTIKGAERIILISALGGIGGAFATCFIQWLKEKNMVLERDICAFIHNQNFNVGDYRHNMAKEELQEIRRCIKEVFVFEESSNFYQDVRVSLKNDRLLIDTMEENDLIIADQIRDYLNK